MCPAGDRPVGGRIGTTVARRASRRVTESSEALDNLIPDECKCSILPRQVYLLLGHIKPFLDAQPC